MFSSALITSCQVGGLLQTDSPLSQRDLIPRGRWQLRFAPRRRSGSSCPSRRSAPPGSAWAAGCAPAIAAVGGSGTHSNSPLDEIRTPMPSGFRVPSIDTGTSRTWIPLDRFSRHQQVPRKFRTCRRGPYLSSPATAGRNSSFPGFGIFFLVPLAPLRSRGCRGDLPARAGWRRIQSACRSRRLA
jgi:hypothetical protein